MAIKYSSRRIIYQICKNCRMKFPHGRLSSIFCGRRCRNAWHNRLRVKTIKYESAKVCDCCNGLFKEIRKWQRFCSVICRNKWHVENVRNRRSLEDEAEGC